MVKDEKDVTRTQSLPGASFSSGKTTLFQIVESKGQHVGLPEVHGDAIVEDKDKELLENAIPADIFERALKSNKKNQQANVETSVKKKIQPRRGMKMLHIPTGFKVTVVKTDVDTDKEGNIRHKVIVAGKSKKFLVPEKSLEVIKNGKA